MLRCVLVSKINFIEQLDLSIELFRHGVNVKKSWEPELPLPRVRWEKFHFWVLSPIIQILIPNVNNRQWFEYKWCELAQYPRSGSNWTLDHLLDYVSSL